MLAFFSDGAALFVVAALVVEALFFSAPVNFFALLVVALAVDLTFSPPTDLEGDFFPVLVDAFFFSPAGCFADPEPEADNLNDPDAPFPFV